VRWQEIALRLTLIVGLSITIGYNVNLWIAAPLGLMAIAATAELAIRPYAASGADKLLLSCGAVATILILVGLGLNLTPWGLTQKTWTITWTILSIGVLAWRRKLRTRIGWPLSRVGLISLWVFLASLIFVAAGMLAVAGVRHSNRQPTLAFSIVSRSADSVVVEIDAISIVDRYRIVATSSIAGARKYISPPLIVGSAGEGNRIFRRVPVNIAGVWVIRLESADNGSVLRWLKVDLH